MAQSRAGAASQNRAQPAPMKRHVGNAHRIDTAVDGMQEASGQPPLDLTRRQAALEQLAPGDHAVLAAGQRRDQPIRACVRLSLSRKVNRTHTGHAFSVPSLGSPVTRTCEEVRNAFVREP